MSSTFWFLLGSSGEVSTKRSFTVTLQCRERDPQDAKPSWLLVTNNAHFHLFLNEHARAVNLHILRRLFERHSLQFNEQLPRWEFEFDGDTLKRHENKTELSMDDLMLGRFCLATVMRQQN
jgi:hypothetical protein